MHRYIGYENLIGTLPDGNLGITNGGRESIDYAAKYASRLIPTSPPPTYVAPPPAPPTYFEPQQENRQCLQLQPRIPLQHAERQPRTKTLPVFL